MISIESSGRSLRALTVGLVLTTALTSCRGASKPVESPLDTEYLRLEQGARGAFARGELEYAQGLYQRLLLNAERSDDARKIGDSAYNLAACDVALGEYARARTLLDEALVELARAGEPVAGVHLVRARLEHLAGDEEACLAAAGRALEAAAGASDRERVEGLALRGLALVATGERGAAEEPWAQAEALVKGDDTPASVLRLRARLAEADGRFEEAARAFDEEAAHLQARSQYHFMAQALELAGRAWLSAGDPPQAGDRLLRAARSRLAHAQGSGVPAQRAITDLADASRVCALIHESGALQQNADLVPRLDRLLAKIDAEREQVQAELDLIEAREGLRDLE